jgi:hypothetical protein
MAFQEAKTVNINQQAVYFVTAGAADLPTTGDFFDVGDWVVNLNPTIALGDPVAWVVTSLGAANNAPTFSPFAYTSPRNVTTVTASTTLTTSVRTVLANATSAGFTLTLPAIGTGVGQANAGYDITIIKTDSSANVVTVAPAGANTVGGAVGSPLLLTQYEILDIRSSGASPWLKQYDTPSNIRTAAGNQTLTTSDRIFISSSAGTLTLPAATTWPAGLFCAIRSVGVNTITPASGNINGAASVTTTAQSAMEISSDGSNYFQVS